MQQIPVYAFTGFLDSGKTKFIQETFEDERFNAGERTLLLVFEEGEEEYDLSTYPHKNVFIETLDQQTVTTKELQSLLKKYKAERVVVELNGMQQVGDLYMKFPEGWIVAQEVMFADSTTIMAEKGLIDGSTFDANEPCTRSSTVWYLWKLAGEPAVANNGRFADVASDAPYAQAVSWAVANGITSGTSENTFSPDEICTRGQIVTFLSNDDERVNGKHESVEKPEVDDGGPAFYKIIEDMVPHPEKPGIYWNPSTGVMFDPEAPWGLMIPS